MKGNRVRLEVLIEKQKDSKVKKKWHNIYIIQDGAKTIDEHTIETIIQMKNAYGYEPAQINKKLVFFLS